MIDKDEKRAAEPVDDDASRVVAGAAEPREAGADEGPFSRQQGVDGADAEPGDLSRAGLEGELETARAEIERLNDQSLRRQAELINYRRRVQREQAESAAVAQARLLEGLVPVIDDFERAVDAESKDARAYHDGMKLILRRVQKALEEIGVERIEPRGEAFDPRYHEAIARQQTDEVPDGQVLDVYQPGYRLKERLIRPAVVTVAYAGDAIGDDPEMGSSAAAEDVVVGDDNGGRDDG